MWIEQMRPDQMAEAQIVAYSKLAAIWQPLCDQRVQGTVFLHRDDRRVEFGFQLVVRLTQADADAATDHHFLRDQGQIGVSFGEGCKEGFVSKNRVCFAVLHSCDGFVRCCELKQGRTGEAT